MNYALIFAGGVGRRMNSKALPKQFLEIHGKPILIYTLENFENHPEIDEICVVCVAEWINYASELIKKYNLQKIKIITAGGDSALSSQYNGLKAIYESSENINKNDIVLIHDGVRPLIDSSLISDCIRCAREYGCAITAVPAIETVVLTDSDGCIKDTIPRERCMVARAPQAFKLTEIYDIHNKAQISGKYDYIDSASMMLDYGYSLHTVQGNPDNIKVTNPSDFYICRALLDARENSQIFGL